MTNKQPLFSIVICVENNSKCVSSTIESIYRQNYSDIEVLVMFCNPDLDEEPLITSLTTLPIVHNIRVIVNKADKPICRSEAIISCLKKASGQYITCISDDSLLQNVEAIALICSFFQNATDKIDAAILSSSLVPAIEGRPPLLILLENLLYNWAPNTLIFNAESIRTYLQDALLTYQLLPEYLILQLLTDQRNIGVYSDKNAAITQRSTVSGALALHRHRYDTISLLRLYLSFGKPFYPQHYYENAWEILNQKLNYYRAYYQVVDLESSKEMQIAANEAYRNELHLLKSSYNKKWVVVEQAKRSKWVSILQYIQPKFREKQFQIAFILILIYDFLLMKELFCPNFPQLLSWIISSGLLLSILLFVLLQLISIYWHFKKLRKWFKFQ